MPTTPDRPDDAVKPTGAGNEAAAGMRATRESDDERPGSEPLDRDREHTSGYGGEGGAPRTSSDTREPHNPT